jgi:hypothetical protein
VESNEIVIMSGMMVRIRKDVVTFFVKVIPQHSEKTEGNHKNLYTGQLSNPHRDELGPL